MLAVSSNGAWGGTGIVWAVHPTSRDATKWTVPGTLQALDAQNLINELWNSDQNSSRDALGMFAKFVPPTVANGKVTPSFV